MVDIPFIRELEFAYGTVAEISPLVRRVIARNPGPFTFHGTGTYIVGRGRVAVIDPGPDLLEHIDALQTALKNETISHIVITHTHRDHSPGAAMLKRATGAATHAFGPHPAHGGGPQIEEGGDMAFRPDHTLRDGDVIAGQGWTLEALHTPGHLSNHLCFALREEAALFTGDHVMGWSTSVISPPEGEMAAYFASLRKLLPRADRIYYPTHGAPVARDPQGFVKAFIAHREDRERQIMACLADGPRSIPQLVATMYRDVPRQLHGAAGRSVLAHLLHMQQQGRIRADGETPETAVWRRADR